MMKNKGGAPLMLDSFATGEEDGGGAEAPSYQIRNNNALQLRAFLFSDGSIFSHDGQRELGTVTMADIDTSTKRNIGKGSSGHVFFAKLLSGTPIALKRIPITTKWHRDEVERELTFFSSRSESPFLMQNLGAYWDSEDNAVVIPMEWMPYNLKDFAAFWEDGMDESLLRDILYQVVRGLQYLHDVKRVIHRDLKPSNILIRDDGYVKIGDFGVSKLVQTLDVSSTYVGTMAYMAPERLEQDHYSFSSDVWSLGLTAVSTVRGGSNPWAPPAELNLFQLLQKISGNSIPVLVDRRGRSFSPAAMDFVAKCLNRQADSRPSCRDLLQHPFFAGCTDATAVERVKAVVQQTTRMLSVTAAKQAQDSRSAGEINALREERIGRLDNL